jgi:hypothetical protein
VGPGPRLLLLLLASAGVAHAAEDEAAEDEWVPIAHRIVDQRAPFVVRDQNPLLAGFGLPSTMPSNHGSDVSSRIDFYWGSTALIQEQGNEALLVDAETREARVTLQGTFMDGNFHSKFGWQLQVPYRYTGGGSLDSFIDSWHDAFGLPDGARSALPRDQIGIAYTRAGTRQLNVTSSSRGLGDIQAALGLELHDSPITSLSAWLNVKLPTGDADELTGSGATDVSLVLAGRRQLSRHWTAFGQAAATYLGDGDVLTDQQRRVVWSGMAGVSAGVWRGLSLKAQVDAHTAAYDSNLDFLSEAVILTLGGDYRFNGDWRLDLGVSEDLAVEHSPDVVFVVGVKKDW